MQGSSRLSSFMPSSACFFSLSHLCWKPKAINSETFIVNYIFKAVKLPKTWKFSKTVHCTWTPTAVVWSTRVRMNEWPNCVWWKLKLHVGWWSYESCESLFWTRLFLLEAEIHKHLWQASVQLASLLLLEYHLRALICISTGTFTNLTGDAKHQMKPAIAITTLN